MCDIFYGTSQDCNENGVVDACDIADGTSQDLDGDGNLVVLELKRNRTPREVVAQLLDYGSWVRTLEDDDIAAIFDRFLQKYDPKCVWGRLSMRRSARSSRPRPCQSR